MTLPCQEMMMRRLHRVVAYNNVEKIFYVLHDRCSFILLFARTAKAFIFYSVTSANLSPQDPWCPSLSIRHLNKLAPRLYISPQDKTLPSSTCKTHRRVKRAHRGEGLKETFAPTEEPPAVGVNFLLVSVRIVWPFRLQLDLLHLNTMPPIECWPAEARSKHSPRPPQLELC